VSEVLGEWEHPDYPVWTYRLEEPVVVTWYRLRVHGPLPGNPGENGEFIMEVRAFGDRPGWWITPSR
jgi:hypothetical protein